MTKLSELEAILFIVGEEGIALDEISHILAIDKEEALRLVAELEERYEDRGAYRFDDQKRASAVVETVCSRNVKYAFPSSC